MATNSIIQAEEITNGGILRIGPLNQQYNPDNLAPHIELGEITHVIDVLGDDFYQDLIVQKNGLISNYNDSCGAPLKNAYPKNQCYEDLWTKGGLKRLCAYATLYVSIPFIFIEITNNGLQKSQSQFGETPEIPELSFLTNAIKQSLETCRNFTEKYIQTNKNCYPLACCNNCLCKNTECECKNDCPRPPRASIGLFTGRSSRKKIKDAYNRKYSTTKKYKY